MNIFSRRSLIIASSALALPRLAHMSFRVSSRRHDVARQP